MSAMFSKEVDFTSATFNAEAAFDSAFFSMANLNSATFNAKTDFGGATFFSALFLFSTFNAKADFAGVTFEGPAFFNAAKFNAEVSFSRATFRADTYFAAATFKDYCRFEGAEEENVFVSRSYLSLQSARFETPDRVSFHTLMLRPHWFVNVDARKFVFIDVKWNWQRVGTKSEVKSLEQKKVSPPHRLLAIACRNLAVNAEENHRYEEASRFRYMAMETRRLEMRRGFVPWRLSWWYWLASGYGERVWRAFVVLIGIWLLAAALYTWVGFVRWEPRVSSEQEAWEARRDEVGQPLRWQRALTYSLGVMTLQKPEPRPATDAAQAVVMLETILGPVQAALLALAIRRKFMR